MVELAALIIVGYALVCAVSAILGGLSGLDGGDVGIAADVKPCLYWPWDYEKHIRRMSAGR